MFQVSRKNKIRMDCIARKNDFPAEKTRFDEFAVQN